MASLFKRDDNRHLSVGDAEEHKMPPAVVTSDDSDSDSAFSKDAQRGVRKVEATTRAWTIPSLIFAYVLIWLIYFVNSLQEGTANALVPYVTSSFGAHSLTATTSILSSIIGGLVKLPLAKVLDIWGRPQGFALMVTCLTMGLVMMAACPNVETYAAAQVFYWVGYDGILYVLSVFIADTSALKNRGLMLAYAQTPYIITIWISGPIASGFLYGPGFRWGYGAWSIISPVVATPLLLLFWWNYRKAKAAGYVPDEPSGRTVMQSIKYHVIEFDIAGILLLAAGLALFLLSFNLYSYQTDGWRSPLVICFLVFGVVLIIAFALYERFLAPKTFIPFELLAERTVLGACVLAATTFVSFYIWNSYFTSFLQVVNGLTVTETSYVANIYTVGSCFWGIIVGIAIRFTGRFKWIALFFGVPLQILGVGLMIHFRQPNVNIGYIIMCQIFIAFAGGTTVICQQVAVMSTTSHQYVAVALAIENMFSSIGGAIGATISAAIWTGTFPEALAKYLPAESQSNLEVIYEKLDVQLSYPLGSPTRDAISQAYGDAQKYMLIGATAIMAIAVVAVALWRDVKVKDHKQVKGRVVDF